MIRQILLGYMYDFSSRFKFFPPKMQVPVDGYCDNVKMINLFL
jgi:hypothetical protein